MCSAEIKSSLVLKVVTDSKHLMREVFLVPLLVLNPLVCFSGSDTQYGLHFLAPPSLPLFSME